MTRDDNIREFYRKQREKWRNENKWDRICFDNFKCSTRHGKGDKYKGDFKEFKDRMESLFKDGMTWQNHGEWHIDHIIPVSKGGLNQIDNIQPLWKIENLQKGSL